MDEEELKHLQLSQHLELLLQPQIHLLLLQHQPLPHLLVVVEQHLMYLTHLLLLHLDLFGSPAIVNPANTKAPPVLELYLIS